MIEKSIINEDNIETLLNILKNNKDVVKDLTDAKILPSSYRLYLRSLSGINDPIDENFFSKSEIKEMRRSVGRSEIAKEAKDKNYYLPKDTIGYSGKDFSVFDALLDPTVNLEMTLGRSNFKKDKEGNYVLEDKYNFNTKSASVLKNSIDPNKLVDKDLLKATIEKYKKGEVNLAGLARVIGGINLGDQNKGVDIKINLGKIEDDEKKEIAKNETIGVEKFIQENKEKINRLNVYKQNPGLLSLADPELAAQIKGMTNFHPTYTVSDIIDFQDEEIKKKIDYMNKTYGTYSPYSDSDYKGIATLEEIL